MDGAVDTARPMIEANPERLGDGYVLPSRSTARARLRGMLEWGTGPVLVTGQAGAGKTWLVRGLAASTPFPWRWAFVDLSPAVDVNGFLRLTLDALGVGTTPRLSVDRPRIERFLKERADDGEHWVLCIDEAHTAAADVLEEIRVLSNRLGEAGRFQGLILLGQNALTRRLAGLRLAALNARIVGRVHLAPVSVEELADWMRAAALGAVDPADVEWLHRQLAGNPRALGQALARRYATPPPRAAARPSERAVIQHEPEPVRPSARPAWTTPLIASTRPPIDEGEGMIEVGWESPAVEESDALPEPVPAPTEPAVTPASTASAALTSPTGEEVVQDHYAALQAWTEWSKNQGRQPVAAEWTEPESLAEVADREEDEGEPPRSSKPPGVWAEAEQGFAPYGQLFTRLKRASDSK